MSFWASLIGVGFGVDVGHLRLMCPQTSGTSIGLYGLLIAHSLSGTCPCRATTLGLHAVIAVRPVR